MKKVLKYSGICAFVLALVGFILMMATPAILDKTGLGTIEYSGVVAIFGHKSTGYLDPEYKAAALGLIAWILILVGLIIVCAGIVLPLLKVKVLERFAGVLNLVAVICFVLAGVFMFIIVPNFYGANGWDVPNTAAIGGGWVVGGILSIVAGAVAICPAVVDFIEKK